MRKYIVRILNKMASVPMHIVFIHVFPKLPAKSLLIFKCVCKSWHTYISSPEFISIHLHHSISSQNCLLILTNTHNSVFSVPLNSQSKPFNLPLFAPSKDGKLVIVGSSNGLVCLNNVSKELPICVLNPCSGFYRELPSLHLPRRPRAVNFGFGYDHVNDDYKVVRLMDYLSGRLVAFSNLCRQVSVFSFKTSTWRVVEWVAPSDCARDGENGAVLMNRLIHWIVWCFELRKCRIKCFDVCEEKWVDDVPMFDHGATHIEENGPGTRDGVLDLGVFDGCLFVSKINEQRSDQINEVIDVWIMKEYGVKESWVKLLSVSDARIARSLRLSPVVYSNNWKKVLVRRGCTSGNRLCWYDLDDESVEIAEFRGVGDCLSTNVCVGSLVRVPGGHRFDKK
ncbi:hypothetical protein RND81_04G077300 [Saponaria officinalis]|uniref:F-box domain-containing protein n=1 Tax=Saponaria officinalis TaxID=3572 RepID=A0AAW1LDK0_SAPOF